MDIIDFIIKESIDKHVILKERRTNIDSIITEGINNCVSRKTMTNTIDSIITEAINDASLRGIRNAIEKNAKIIESDKQSMENGTVGSIVKYSYDIINAIDCQNVGDPDDFENDGRGSYKNKKRKWTTAGADMLHGVLNDLGKAGFNGLTDPAQKFMYDYRNSRDWFERNFGGNGNNRERRTTRNLNGKGSGTNSNLMQLAGKKGKYEQQYKMLNGSLPRQTDTAIRDIFSCIDQIIGQRGSLGPQGGNAGQGQNGQQGQNGGSNAGGQNGQNGQGQNGQGQQGQNGQGQNGQGQQGQNGQQGQQQPDLSQQLTDWQKSQEDMYNDFMKKQTDWQKQQTDWQKQQTDWQQKNQSNYDDLLKGQKDALDQSKANHDAMMQQQNDWQSQQQANHDAMMQQMQANHDAMVQSIKDNFDNIIAKIEERRQRASSAGKKGAAKKASKYDELLQRLREIQEQQIDWQNMDQTQYNKIMGELNALDKSVENVGKKVDKNGREIVQRIGETQKEKKEKAKKKTPKKTNDGKEVIVHEDPNKNNNK